MVFVLKHALLFRTETLQNIYHQTSNIRSTLKIADHSDVVGASPVDTAPTKSSFST